MEKLKLLEDVCQPDIRYRGRIDLDKTTGTVSETTIRIDLPSNSAHNPRIESARRSAQSLRDCQELGFVFLVRLLIQCRGCDARVRIT